jgi:TatD DNase family protein
MLFDTHAHYDDEAFDADRDELLASMPGRGVGLIVNPGITVETSRTAVELAARHPHVYAAVGIHPENCEGFSPEWMEEIRALAARPKVVALGEIGLDYYWGQPPVRELQREVLRRHMALARELDLPVIVHDREAHADCLAVVKEFPEVEGVFHCYSGSAEMARELVKLGWMLSFTGSITFKSARKAPEVIAEIPLDRIMIETDSPYLTPAPNRGKRNDSGSVRVVAEKIAEIRGLPAEEVERLTWENGKRFFRIP